MASQKHTQSSHRGPTNDKIVKHETFWRFPNAQVLKDFNLSVGAYFFSCFSRTMPLATQLCSVAGYFYSHPLVTITRWNASQ